MSNYTERINADLYNIWGKYDTSEEEYGQMIEYLNSSDFRTFGEGLTDLINTRAKDGESTFDCLKRCFKEKGIDIKELGSPNTPKNWLNGGERPKKGEDSRRKMYILAFALGLTSDETAYLFQRIFLDRAYNPRNYKELIYAYCIENNLPFSKAEEMISKVVIEASDAADKTVYTKMIAAVMGESKSENDIVDYINNHPHNFSINNVAAKNKVEEYVLKAKNAVWKEIVIKYKFISGEIFQVEETKVISYDEYISKGLDRDKLIISDHYVDRTIDRDLTTINFVYEFITDIWEDKGRLGTVASHFKNAFLPKEISTSFPSPQIFSKVQKGTAKEPTYDELRKMLILLFSYCHWSEGTIPNQEDRTDYYMTQLNNVLFESNLPELYPGNPFDWLFCFCTMADNPLDTFRAILAEVLDTEE